MWRQQVVEDDVIGLSYFIVISEGLLAALQTASLVLVVALSTMLFLSRLFTEEDPYHVHKILGTSCLISFISHLSRKDLTNDATFGDIPVTTVSTIALHLFLSISSFAFRIPTKRMKGGAFRIWPEYRLHSFIFSCRSLIGMALICIQFRYNLSSDCFFLLKVINVLATCVAADFASQKLEPSHRSNTIRDTNARPILRCFFSIAQFHGTMGCILMGNYQFIRYFLMLGIIQVNAFLMTLQRKNLLPHFIIVGLYGILLLSGFMVGSKIDALDDRSVIPQSTIGNMAAVLRMGPLHLNKYVLWMGVGLFMYQFDFEQIDPGPVWLASSVLSHLALFSITWDVCRKDFRQGNTTSEEKRVN